MVRPPLPLETWGAIRRFNDNGKPTARALYRDSDGVTRAVQRSGKTLAAAERNLIEALRKRETPSHEDLNAESTVGQAVKNWLDTKALKLSESSQNVYRNANNNIVSFGLGSVRLRELTVPRVERFLTAVTEKNGPSSAKTARTVLNNAITDAVRLGAIAHNPISSTTVPEIPKKPITAPSATAVREIRALIRAYDEGTTKRGLPRHSDIADLVDLYAATGARTSELLALDYPSIDFDAEPVRVEINKTLIVGTDGKLKVQDHPKTARSKRVLKLIPFAANILMRRRVNAYNEIVFPSSTGTYRWPHNLRRIWREALEGSPYEQWTPRDFRKAVATIVKDVYGVEEARDQLGQVSIRTTEKHYIMPSFEGPDVAKAFDLFFENGE